MAELVSIQGQRYLKRNPLGVLGLSFITLGIYFFYWYYQVNDELRFVQLTPPGSACSIAIGTGLTQMEPGSIEGLMMVVADVQAARDKLMQRGTDVSEVDVQPWGSFVYFSDPDGNTWVLQQLPN